MQKEELRENRIKAMEALYRLDANNLGEIENEYALNVVSYYNRNQERVDSFISKCLYNYSLNQLSMVNRAIVRLATIEMLNDLAPSIVINEALEIAKVYSDSGDNKDVKFLNKLLDNISKAI